MNASQSNCKECPKQKRLGMPAGCDLDEMVADYCSRHFEPLEDNLKSLLTYTDFICGRPNRIEAPGVKKYCKGSHHFRLPNITIEEAHEKLKIANLDRYSTFAEIHAAVHDIAKGIKKFGMLATYDFTQRYCYSRGIEPDGVYLHAGVVAGARELEKLGYQLNIIDLDDRGSMIELSSLPEPIAQLGTLHAENFLCIYKHLLAKLADSQKSNN